MSEISFKNKKILVAGAAGFIGSNLAMRVLEESGASELSL